MLGCRAGARQGPAPGPPSTAATVALLLDEVQVGILRQVAGADAVLPNTLRVLAAVRKRRVRTVLRRHSFMPTEPAGAYQPWQGKARRAEAARGAG